MLNRHTFLRLTFATCVVSVGFVSSAEAQRSRSRGPSLSTDRLTGGPKVRALFKSVVKRATESTVAVYTGKSQTALGTIISSNGWILTKASQLRGDDFSCKFSDGTTLTAEVVAYHREYDLAMLKVESKEAKPLPVMPLSTKATAKLGHWVVTPGTSSVPVAVGVMSVHERSIRRGRGELGVGIEDVEGEDGVKVNRIFENGAADKAGVKINDVVVTVDGNKTVSRRDLIAAVRKSTAGDRVVLGVMRAGKTLKMLATLRHPAQSMMSRGSIQNRMGGKLSERRSGFPGIIQHDTVLRPEWCGGPLLNIKGEVVGINIARAGRTESYAIPIPKLLPLIEELKAGKHPAPKLVNYWTDGISK